MNIPNTDGYAKEEAYKQLFLTTPDQHLKWTIRGAYFSPCTCHQCWTCYVADVFSAFLTGEYESDVSLLHDDAWSEWDQIRFVLRHGLLGVGKADRNVFYGNLL